MEELKYYDIDNRVKLAEFPMKTIDYRSPSYPLNIFDMAVNWESKNAYPSQNVYPSWERKREFAENGRIPKEIYVFGDEKVLSHPRMVAIVGTRNPSKYGESAARTISRHAIKKDFVIVSGLAYGIDAIAHRATFEFWGKTVAVVPMGLDNISPKGHLDIAKYILWRGGCIVSIQPPGTKYSPHLYIQRNAIQTILSSIVVIVETPSGGGTMHTAAFANHQRRLVATIQYEENLSTNSDGNKILINDGNCDFIINEKEDINTLFTKEFEQNLHNKL